MRSKSFISVLGVAGFVFATALVVNNFSFAQELVGQAVETKEVTTEDQMAQLIESQNNLTNALEKLLVKQEPDVGGQQMSLLTGTAPRPYCVSDSSTYNSSNTYQQSDWDTVFFVNVGEHFYDINGDGLVDYVYSNRSGSAISACVYLNTGSGWERVFKCYATYASSTWTYRGNCAA